MERNTRREDLPGPEGQGDASGAETPVNVASEESTAVPADDPSSSDGGGAPTVDGEAAPGRATSDNRWRRSRTGRLIAGVASTFAERSGLPVWLVRVGFVAAAIAGGFGLAAYLAAWALMPDEDADRSLTDTWRVRFAAAETPGEKTGLVLIALAVALAVAATGVLAAPLTIATLLVVAGIALLRPIEN